MRQFGAIEGEQSERNRITRTTADQAGIVAQTAEGAGFVGGAAGWEEAGDAVLVVLVVHQRDHVGAVVGMAGLVGGDQGHEGGHVAGGTGVGGGRAGEGV